MKCRHFTAFLFWVILGLSYSGFCQTAIEANKMEFSQFVFLNFHIKKTTTNPNGEVVLSSYKIVQGKPKQSPFNRSANRNKKDFLITLKDGNGKIISESAIPNPLEEELEYPNENGVIGTATISKTETDFSVRLPYSNDCLSTDIQQFGEGDRMINISSLLLKNDKR